MTITEIEYGSIASSKKLNDNFNALNKDIQDLATNLSTTNANLVTNISTLNKNLTSQITELADKISSTQQELEEKISDTTGSLFTDNALYVTTYINGNTWYKEYFSDKEKTTRVWLEQGGYVNFGNAQFATRTITFPIAFTAICNAMGILFSPGGADDSNQGVAGWSNTTLTYVHRGWGSGVVWRAVGK